MPRHAGDEQAEYREERRERQQLRQRAEQRDEAGGQDSQASHRTGARPYREPRGPGKAALARSLAVLAVLAAAAAPAAAQERPPAEAGGIRIDGPPPPVAPDVVTRDADGRVTMRAVRIGEPLRVDGALAEAFYGETPAVTGFVQQMPDEGAPSQERTDVWIFFDDDNVYVAARIWEAEPEEEWIANAMQRDAFPIIFNDNFSVAFDTFYDRRNGVAFMVNPIGGFFDYEISDEGNPNNDWNPVWDVRTGRFDGGWTVEMAIPFRSLRYAAGRSQVWGVQIGRRQRRLNEWSYLTPVPISAGPGMFRLSVAGTLVGLEAPEQAVRLEVKPYGIGSLATDLTADEPYANRGDGTGGVDVKWGVTQNLTADFTFNTDFAQVEVDQQQVNLTRFNLFFPEKRDFFLESRGLFDFGAGPNQLGRGGGSTGARGEGPPGTRSGNSAPLMFFSRRIGLSEGQTVPIRAGGRLTGKVGRMSVGALNIQTGDEPNVDARATNFTVVRMKADVLRRSRIGGMYTRRSVATNALGADPDRPGANEVYGADASFAFYDNVTFNGYYARTRTTGLTGDDQSYQAAFTYSGDLYGVQVDHLLVGRNFNPEIGFRPREDFRRTWVSAQYSPRPSSIDAVRQFTWGGSLDYIESTAGQLETRAASVRFSTEFENSDRFNVDLLRNYELLVEPFDITDDVSIAPGAYRFQDLYLSYFMGEQRRFSGTAFVQQGRFYGGDITAFGYRGGRVEVTPQFSLEPTIELNRIDIPEGRFTVALATSRVTYTFTPRMFVSGLVQYNSVSSQLGTNVRFRWEYLPGSELFFVYNDQRDTMLRRAPMLESRSIVVKLTRLLRF